MAPAIPYHAVLLLIDLQQAVDHPSWGKRNNPNAEYNIARLLALWRENDWPVWHIRHDSTDPNSHYRPGQPGHDFKPEAMPKPREPVIGKTTNNAFIGTHLERQLRDLGYSALVVCGVITNNSVEATVRMAGNLGFDTYLVSDACFTFGRADLKGHFHSAEEIHDISLANMNGEYCTVIDTVTALGSI
jgi:nicotinamidase-related amidase